MSAEGSHGRSGMARQRRGVREDENRKRRQDQKAVIGTCQDNASASASAPSNSRQALHCTALHCTTPQRYHVPLEDGYPAVTKVTKAASPRSFAAAKACSILPPLMATVVFEAAVESDEDERGALDKALNGAGL